MAINYTAAENTAQSILDEMKATWLSSDTVSALKDVLGTGKFAAADSSSTDAQKKAADVLFVTEAGKIDDTGNKVVIVNYDASEYITRAATDDFHFTAKLASTEVYVGSANSEKIELTSKDGVTVETGGGDDSVTTGSGNDVVRITGDGEVTVNTGAGDDIIELHTNISDVTVDGGAGFDVFDTGSMTRDQFEIFTKGANVFMVGVDEDLNEGEAGRLNNIEVVTYGDNTETTVFAYTHEQSVVAKLYHTVFDRDTDVDGYKFWKDTVDTGKMSLIDVANAFVASKEFSDTYDTMSNVEFLKTMYDNTFGRDFDQAGLDYWTGRMTDGMTRAEVVLAFAESDEADQAMGVDNQYVIELF